MDRSFDATGLGRNHREQIERVVDELHDVLGADLLGSYLYGSAVEGGLRPRSDVDLLAISRVRATERQRQRLVSRLLAISSDSTDLGPSRPIDLAVVVGSEIRPWRYPPHRGTPVRRVAPVTVRGLGAGGEPSARRSRRRAEALHGSGWWRDALGTTAGEPDRSGAAPRRRQGHARRARRPARRHPMGYD